MITAVELAKNLRRSIGFRYLTIDAGGIRMWGEKPHYDSHSRRWVAPSAAWIGAISLDAVKLLYPLRFRDSLVEVEG